MTNPQPARARRRVPVALYALFCFSIFALLLAIAGFAFSFKALRERHSLRRLLSPEITYVTLASFDEFRDDEERLAHIRSCYLHPDSVRLDQVLWFLPMRPAPFVNYAPKPGAYLDGNINQAQLRSSRELVLPKPPGTFRIFLTGGSSAFGSGAPGQDGTIDAFLEGILRERLGTAGPAVEVFNAAVPAWSSTHERIMIENRIWEWEPDLVIAYSGVNDIHWSFEGRNPLYMRAYSDETYFVMLNATRIRAGLNPLHMEPPFLEEVQIPVDRVARRVVHNWSLAASAMASLDVPILYTMQPYLSERWKPLTPGEKSALAKHRLVEPNHTEARIDYMERCADAIGSALAELQDATPNFHAADFRNVFEGVDEPVYIDIYHYGDRGNQIIARQLADRVEEIAGDRLQAAVQ